MDDLRSVWLKAHIVEERVVFCIEVETSADLSGNTKVYSGGKRKKTFGGSHLQLERREQKNEDLLFDFDSRAFAAACRIVRSGAYFTCCRRSRLSNAKGKMAAGVEHDRLFASVRVAERGFSKIDRQGDTHGSIDLLTGLLWIIVCTAAVTGMLEILLLRKQTGKLSEGIP